MFFIVFCFSSQEVPCKVQQYHGDSTTPIKPCVRGQAVSDVLSHCERPRIHTEDCGEIDCNPSSKNQLFFLLCGKCLFKICYCCACVCCVGGRARGSIACMWRSEDTLRKSLMSFHICVCSGTKLRLSGQRGTASPAEPSYPVVFLPYLRWCTYRQCSIQM